MREDDIINEFKSIINSLYLQGFIKDNNGETSTLLKNLLELYQQEKEKNKKVITYIKEKQKIQYKYALSQIECDKILELLLEE